MSKELKKCRAVEKTLIELSRNSKCRTHIVGSIERHYRKPDCYWLKCERCGFEDIVGTWSYPVEKRGNRNLWNKRQYEYIYLVINIFESFHYSKASKVFGKYYSKKELDKNNKEFKESLKKSIDNLR